MAEVYRIRASLLDEDELFVGATVKSVTLDGTVTLEENVSNNPRTWTTTIDNFDEWKGRNLAARHDDLADPSHSLWTTLADAYSEVTESPHAEGGAAMQSDIHSAFTTLVYEHSQ